MKRRLENGGWIFAAGQLFCVAAGIRAVQYYRVNPNG